MTSNAESINSSGQALVDHWKWAAEKGLMNNNTAASLGAATRQVLSVVDNWQTLDVRALDVEDILRRFQNKRGKDFVPQSLNTYKARFAQAVRLFISYLDDPGGWKPTSGNGRTPTRQKKQAVRSTDAPLSAERESPSPPRVTGLVEYPFPLREGRFAYLRLPVDLSKADVQRLTAYLNTLVMDSNDT